jgi:hypothetical protein
MSYRQIHELSLALTLSTVMDTTALYSYSYVSPDNMMRVVNLMNGSIGLEVLTFRKLMTLLSEGFKVIMWGGYIGEEILPYVIDATMVGWTDSDELWLQEKNLKIYHKYFDLLDRHEGEVASGDINDTLFAPYLALIIPQGNSND